MIKCTIVIPVYNGALYLAECIDSAIIQGCEVIVVNDGSTDFTESIIDRYASFGVIKINKPNGGTASALNVGIMESKYDWIKWLSADDVLLPNAVRNMIEFTYTVAQPHSKLFYTDYNIINTKSEIQSTFYDKQYLHQKAELYNNFFGNGSTSLIHKSAFAMTGLFKEKMPYNDDYEFWLRWVLEFGLIMQHIPIVTINYRVHKNSLTSTKNTKENMLLVEKLRQQYYQYLTDEDKIYLKTLKRPLKRRIGRYLPKPIRMILRKFV